MVICTRCKLLKKFSEEKDAKVKGAVVEVEKVVKKKDDFIKSNEYCCFVRFYEIYMKSGLLCPIDSYSINYLDKKSLDNFYDSKISEYRNLGFK